MKIEYIDLDDIKYYGDLCVTIGYFDGIHLGHQKLINLMIENSNNLIKTLITFETNPATFLNKEKRTDVLLSREQKISIFENLGIELLLIIKTSEDNYKTTYEDFIDKFLNIIGCRKLIVGFDFHFGLSGLGNVLKIKNHSTRKFEIIELEKQNLENEKISSSNIRKHLENGEIEKANKMLGRFYEVSGNVDYGKQLGRTIGFPTANIYAYNSILPKCGVYLVNVTYENEEYIGICNIGCRPTVDDDELINLEVHILNFANDIYGIHLNVAFIEHLREEMKFDSIEELVSQLNKDKEYAFKSLSK